MTSGLADEMRRKRASAPLDIATTAARSTPPSHSRRAWSRSPARMPAASPRVHIPVAIRLATVCTETKSGLPRYRSVTAAASSPYEPGPSARAATRLNAKLDACQTSVAPTTSAPSRTSRLGVGVRMRHQAEPPLAQRVDLHELDEIGQVLVGRSDEDPVLVGIARVIGVHRPGPQHRVEVREDRDPRLEEVDLVAIEPRREVEVQVDELAAV